MLPLMRRVALGASLLVLGCSARSSSLSPGADVAPVTTGAQPVAASATPNPGGAIPIKHFIYIIQENISYDHYFGTYPGGNGIPSGVKLAYRPGGPPRVYPFHLHATSIPHDLNHSWQAAHLAFNDGKMDGFLWAEWPAALRFYWKGELPGIDPEDIIPQDENEQMVQEDIARANRGGPATTAPGGQTGEAAAVAGGNAPTSAPARGRGGVGAPPRLPPPDWVLNTLSYYDWHEIPNYWEYARRFTLCDNFFSSLAGPSEPNHLYTVAAQSGGLVNNPGRGIAGEEGVYTFPTMAERHRVSRINCLLHLK
jgi:phospholipase C